jgi:hypothetical protein
MSWLRRPKREDPALDATFRALLDDHSLAAFERQLSFSKYAGDRDWQLDLDRGILRLLPDIELRAQVLGTVSHEVGTWLWAWANETVPSQFAEQAATLRRLGEERQMEILTTPEVPVSAIGDGHLMALAAAGALDANAYYRCPYEGGEAYVLVELPRQPGPHSDLIHVVHVVSTALTSIPPAVTAAAIRAYLSARDIRFDEKENEIVATTESGQATFRFDNLGRLSELVANT